jgi:tight adherence protein C
MTNVRAWLVSGSLTAAVVMISLSVTGRRRLDRRRFLAALAPPRTERRYHGTTGLAIRLGRSAPARLLMRGSHTGADFADRFASSGSLWTVEEFAGRSLIAAGVGVAMAVAAATLLGPFLVVLTPLVALVGAKVPAIRLARRARRRAARIDAQVPELVELLVAASESGLPPPAAFVRSADALLAPLGDELRDAAARIRLGEPWRDALDRAVKRTRSPSLAMLARSLERSHRLGASVRGALHALVDELRAERRARAEERARRAPVKMLFPLVFLILPAFLLLTVGPVLLSTVRSLH